MNSRSIPADWLPQYTYADYARWEGDWELIFGFPYAMSPSPKRTHQAAGRNFVRLADTALQQAKLQCECEVYYELDWIVNENTVVRPDVMIVCGKFDEDFLSFPPALILEIASEGTIMKDRNVKYSLYQSQGVRYYVMVHPETKSAETFQLINNQYQQVELKEFQLTSTCSIPLDIQQIWL
jgi:Uma2 family endonuclease